MWIPPRAGSLVHRLTIQRNNPTRSNGLYTDSWEDFYDAWAQISTSGGREFYAARQATTDLTHEITVRWYPGITAGMRIRYEDPTESTTRYFTIRAILRPTERTDWIVLHAAEIQGGQARTK